MFSNEFLSNSGSGFARAGLMKAAIILEMVGKQMMSEQTSKMDFQKSNYRSLGLKFYGPFSLIYPNLILIRRLRHANMTAIMVKVGIETVMRTRQAIERAMTILRILLNQKVVGSKGAGWGGSAMCVLAYSIERCQTKDLQKGMQQNCVQQNAIQGFTMEEFQLVDNEVGLGLQIKYNKQVQQQKVRKIKSSHQVKQEMLNKKPDTIQGFLSPTKLLSASSKNSKFNNSKGTKSPLGSPTYNNKKEDNKYNSQNQSYLNTSRQIDNNLEQANEPNFGRLTGENNRFMATQPVGEKKYESQRNFAFDKDARTLAGYPNRKANLSIAQEDQLNSNRQRTLEEINNRKWQTEKFRDIDRQSPLYQPKLKNDPTANFRQNFSLPKSSVSEIVNLKSSNPQMMTIQCYELIRKLSKVKENLELQILQLQTLLDNTSKYMDSMDEEFDRIKDNILAHTARSLDSAFTEYKQNMIQWQKYEDFQRKSISMLTEMNDYIYNEEQRLSQSKKLTYRQLTMTAQEIQKQINYYKQFAQEISKIRDQCNGMRPTLTQERVKQFEKGLAILCNF